MADIAEIGFRVDTTQLENAEKKLNRLPAAAAGVDAANNKMARTAEGAATAVAAAATAAARAENQKAAALVKSLQASEKVSREELKAAQSAERRTAAVLANAKAEETRVNSLNKAAAALRATSKLEIASSRPSTSVSGVVSGGRVQDAVPARDQMPNRFNTGNIAAQFQDIGVTAAMGMNPLQIALQQGTQLSAILQTMENPLKGIAVAFRQIINPVSLMAIGFVAVVAAILQFVNWTKVAQAVLRGLASALETAAPYAAVLATTLALIYAPTIISGLYTVTAAIVRIGIASLVTGAQMAGAWILGLGPIGIILAAIGAVILATMAFRDELKKMLGFDVLDSIKSGINTVLEYFSRLFDSIYYGFKVLVARMKSDSESAAKFKKLAQANDVIMNPPQVIPDRVGALGDKITGFAKEGAAGLRKFASGLGKGDGKDKKDPWEELVKGAERQIATFKAQADAVGLSVEAAAKLKYQTDLLNEAQQKNIDLTPKQIEKINQLSTQMAQAETEAKRLQEAYDFLRDAGKGFISDLRSGLDEGKSLWESFGAAVKNVIDKILNKLIDSQINSIIDSFMTPKSGGGASAGGSILSGIADFLGFANGGAFGGNGVQKFAQGGMFTNSIVNRATPFMFANGGAMGVMGEAGPEAIMPLHRGPDGSLGVKMNNASNDNSQSAQQPSVTYVINAPGASKADLESVKQTIMAVAGPGIVEQRVINAQTRGAI